MALFSLLTNFSLLLQALKQVVSLRSGNPAKINHIRPFDGTVLFNIPAIMTSSEQPALARMTPTARG
jgi:hypothetical protein